MYCKTVRTEVERYRGKELAGSRMYFLCENFADDLRAFADWNFAAWFDFVKAIPYVSDEDVFPGEVVEVLARPKILLDSKIFPALDCKKKSVLIGSWAEKNRIPYRFLAVSEKLDGDIHHVFPQLDFGGGWITADATLPDYKIGQGFPITKAVELKR